MDMEKIKSVDVYAETDGVSNKDLLMERLKDSTTVPTIDDVLELMAYHKAMGDSISLLAEQQSAMEKIIGGYLTRENLDSLTLVNPADGNRGVKFSYKTESSVSISAKDSLSFKKDNLGAGSIFVEGNTLPNIFDYAFKNKPKDDGREPTTELERLTHDIFKNPTVDFNDVKTLKEKALKYLESDNPDIKTFAEKVVELIDSHTDTKTKLVYDYFKDPSN